MGKFQAEVYVDGFTTKHRESVKWLQCSNIVQSGGSLFTNNLNRYIKRAANTAARLSRRLRSLSSSSTSGNSWELKEWASLSTSSFAMARLLALKSTTSFPCALGQQRRLLREWWPSAPNNYLRWLQRVWRLASSATLQTNDPPT